MRYLLRNRGNGEHRGGAASGRRRRRRREGLHGRGRGRGRQAQEGHRAGPARHLRRTVSLRRGPASRVEFLARVRVSTGVRPVELLAVLGVDASSSGVLRLARLLARSPRIGSIPAFDSPAVPASAHSALQHLCPAQPGVGLA